jgi:AmmeMemoRadiSam system protein A
MISPDDRLHLLRIARTAIRRHVDGLPPLLPDEAGGIGACPAGAFVSLHKHGQLRGCIGHIHPDRALALVIADCAVAAATADPRFPPVSGGELADLEIELSILGPLETVERLDEVEIGRDGLVIERGWSRGLLLPQVAVERGWSRETFLEQTCHKAGLPRDAWSHGASLWKFGAEVFSDQ